MYRVVMICEGVPERSGHQAALDITQEFKARPHHNKATCSWSGSVLRLEVENDYDENGLATQDEFSDAISACVMEAFDGDIVIESIVEF